MLRKTSRKKFGPKQRDISTAQGLELGLPSFEAARKAIKYFRKAGLHSAAKALEFILGWVLQRPRRNGRKDDLLTVIDVGAERGRQGITSHMSARTTLKSRTSSFYKSKNFWKNNKSIWNVVRLPYGTEESCHTARDRRSNEVQIHEASLWTTKNFDAVLAESKMGFSDGTRGVGEVPVCIRPAAFGAITFKYGILDGKPHFYDIECCGGQVPGEQTVPRAELWAAIVLMTRCNANAVARFGIDAAYVTQGVGNRQKLVKREQRGFVGHFLYHP